MAGDAHLSPFNTFKDAAARFPQAEFLASTGDNNPVGNYRGWDGFNEHVKKTFGAGFPWFIAPGNHNADNPPDMAYLMDRLVPHYKTQLRGATNFNAAVLTYESVDLRMFDIFKRGGDDKTKAVLDVLVQGKVGSVKGGRFHWAQQDLTLEAFSKVVEGLDLRGCLLDNYRMDSVEKAREGLKTIYMANRFTPYSFDYKGIHFVFLNLYYDSGYQYGNIFERQWAWLEADLKANKSPMTFVFGHEPAFPFGPRHWGDCLDEEPEIRDKFVKILNEHRVAAYFSGHTHVYGRTFLGRAYDANLGTSGGKGERNQTTYVAVEVEGAKARFKAYGKSRVRPEPAFTLRDEWYVDLEAPESWQWGSITPGVGGWVTALAIDPNDPGRVLVGGDVLGIAASRDGGRTWNPSSGLTNYEIESFFLPDHPYHGNFYFAFAATVGGVAESFDGGLHWMEKISEGKWDTGKPLDDWPAHSEKKISRPVSSLGFSVQTGQIYAASGAVRSPGRPDPGAMGTISKFHMISDGQGWRHVADLKKVTGGAANIQSLLVQGRRGKPDRLYAGLLKRGLWLTEDAGSNWRASGLQVKNVYTVIGHPENTDLLYAATGAEGLFKSVDGGRSWANIHKAPSQVVALCRARPDVLYAGSYRGAHKGVLKSTDAGASWSHVYKGPEKRNAPNLHGSTNLRYHALAVDPADPDHVIAGDDVNLYVTFDGGKSWQSSGSQTPDKGASWTPSAFSGVCAEFCAFNLSDANHFLLGGADGALWQTWDGGKTYQRTVTDALDPNLPAGDKGEVFSDFQDGAVSERSSRTLYLVVDLHSDRIEDAGPLFKSEDEGKSWKKVSDGPFESVTVYGKEQDHLLCAASGSIRKSTDGGRTFVTVHAGKGVRKVTRHPSQPHRFFASSEEGVLQSRDGGDTWRSLGGPRVWGRFGKVVAHPGRPEVLFATSFQGFWRYDATGWKQIKQAEFASDIAVTPEGRIYGAVTSFPNHDKDPLATGLWMSEDGGRTWNAVNQGLRVRRVKTLDVNPLDGRVVAGTDGGGFFSNRFQGKSLASVLPTPALTARGEGGGSLSRGADALPLRKLAKLGAAGVLALALLAVAFRFRKKFFFERDSRPVSLS